MDDDLRRMLRIGLALLATAGILFILYYMTLQTGDLAEKPPEEPQLVVQAWLDKQKLDPVHAIGIEQCVTQEQAQQRQTWSLLTMTPMKAVELRDRLRDMEQAANGLVHSDNHLGLDDLHLPILDRPPVWWLDPRTLGAAITVLQEPDASGKLQVTYLAISYATGQAYVCQWSGLAEQWKDRPTLRNAAPATYPVAQQH